MARLCSFWPVVPRKVFLFHAISLKVFGIRGTSSVWEMGCVCFSPLPVFLTVPPKIARALLCPTLLLLDNHDTCVAFHLLASGLVLRRKDDQKKDDHKSTSFWQTGLLWWSCWRLPVGQEYWQPWKGTGCGGWRSICQELTYKNGNQMVASYSIKTKKNVLEAKEKSGSWNGIGYCQWHYCLSYSWELMRCLVLNVYLLTFLFSRLTGCTHLWKQVHAYNSTDEMYLSDMQMDVDMIL